jgi:hypothetical protein
MELYFEDPRAFFLQVSLVNYTAAGIVNSYYEQNCKDIYKRTDRKATTGSRNDNPSIPTKLRKSLIKLGFLNEEQIRLLCQYQVGGYTVEEASLNQS